MSANLDRLRVAGRIPQVGTNILKMMMKDYQIIDQFRLKTLHVTSDSICRFFLAVYFIRTL